MVCGGCGNEKARITKTFALESGLVEYCDLSNCGGLKAPYVPDVFFPGPHFSENLGDENHPNGIFVESKRHKARLLAAQGLREDGDRVHGSVFRDARKPKREFKKDFQVKLDNAIRMAVKKSNKRS